MRRQGLHPVPDAPEHDDRTEQVDQAEPDTRPAADEDRAPMSDGEHLPAVVRAAQAYYRSEIDPEDLLAAFRAASLFVHRQISPPAVMVTEIPARGSWIQAFTDRDRLEAAVGTGDYMTLLGAEILDLLLPALAIGAGVLLDPGSPHMIAFPHMPTSSSPDAETSRSA